MFSFPETFARLSCMYDTLRVCRGQFGLMRGGGSHDPVGDACDNVTGEEGRGILSG